MEHFDGTTIFWLFTLGMVIGAAAKIAMGNKGMGVISNVVGGALGSVIVGGIGVGLNMPGSLLFALLGSLSVLFLGNVFYVQPEIHEH